jgi:O-antigen/teichoic acid export membrane protein
MIGRLPLLLGRLRNPNFRNIAVYGMATGLAALLTLVQTRILWRALTPTDFGVWALIDPMLLPIASLVLLGVDHSIVKQFRIDRLPLRLVTGTLLGSTVPASLLCLVAIGVVAQVLLHLAWTSALLLTIAGEALILMMQTAFRATGAVGRFAAVLLTRNLFYLGLLLLVRAATVAGPLPIDMVFLTRGGCVILISIVAMLAMRPVLRFDWTLYRDAVHYGFPLLLTTFVYAVTDMTDRWFLAEFTGVVAVGIYAVHLKVAAILSQAIVIPFGMWFPPERFKRLDDPDEGRSFFIRTAAALAVICCYLSGVVWLARDLVLSLIAPGATASPLVAACCLAAVTCLALSQALNVGLLTPGHTGKNVICTAGALAATIVAAGVLVPLFGVDGAAGSRLIGGVVLVGVTAAWSNRILPVDFPFAELFVYACASIITAACIDRAVGSSDLPRLLIALIAWTAASAAFAWVVWSRLPAIRRDEDVAAALRDLTPSA